MPRARGTEVGSAWPCCWGSALWSPRTHAQLHQYGAELALGNPSGNPSPWGCVCCLTPTPAVFETPQLSCKTSRRGWAPLHPGAQQHGLQAGAQEFPTDKG